jgi:hypothetical protein
VYLASYFALFGNEGFAFAKPLFVAGVFVVYEGTVGLGLRWREMKLCFFDT